MAARLLKDVANRAQDRGKTEEVLTEREIEVLRVLATGASNPQIGSELNITVNTVKTHIKHILAKLQIGKPHAGRGLRRGEAFDRRALIAEAARPNLVRGGVS